MTNTKPEPGSCEAIERARRVLKAVTNPEVTGVLFLPRRESALDRLQAEVGELREELKRAAKNGSSANGQNRMLKIREAAAYARVSPAKLRQMILAGHVPVVRGSTPNSTAPWRVDRADLDELIEREKEQF